MPCPPPPHWRLKQVDALRVLFRYASGIHNRNLIPDWVVFCQRQHAQQGRKLRSAGAKPLTDQLSNFKAGKNRLDFVDGGSNPKLDYVRQKLWEFYEENEDARTDVFDYYKTVYDPEPLSHIDIKMWLTEIHDATPDGRALSRLRGVYHIYRYGLIVDGFPTIVRSAMIVRRATQGDIEYMTFAISYPNTSERGTDQIEHITGIVLDAMGHYYFTGADDGASSSPYQLIAKQHSANRAPTELSGLLMRHSLRNEVLAARALIVRVSGDEHATAPSETYEADYKAAVRQVKVLGPKDVAADKRLDERRLAKFTNVIEEHRAPVLWLIPDDNTLPPPPPIDEQTDRDRPRRRSR